MKITFLGTGTSQGVPVIACNCNTCLSNDSKDKRLRASVLISIGNKNILIDSGPDFRYQMLRAKVQSLDAILFTHEHKDHTGGLDDVRAYNWVTKQSMEVYAEYRVLEALKVEYAYCFAPNPYPGIPKINLNTITENPFNLLDIEVIPIRGMHLKLPVLGYRIGDFAYLTDFNFISEEEKKKLTNLQVLVVNGVRKEKHISHYSLPEAIALIEEIKPHKGYITHISHYLGLHAIENREFPHNISLAYDMQELEI
ncbi:MBL fold metallo-hydrolase [Saccharicrinis aurantiacus]|uniref:MBL fold metallo-hydrolase n=1 Tax=Saccharicrinis aurantiacus TaxID=1849719 RepID=UPI002490E1B2|nr:MBL fold metallo-hydrolase [Saccharicrinis aurantiacus]